VTGVAAVRDVGRLFIGGRWVVPSTGDTLDVVEAHTERVLGRVPVAGRVRRRGSDDA